MKTTSMLAAAVVVGLLSVATPAYAQTAEPTPVCVEDRQCLAMWLAAIEEIEVATGMRVSNQNDSVIETYVAGDTSRKGTMYGRVIKRPLPSGGYAIVATLECSYRSCRNLREPALDEFNRRLTAIGQQFVPGAAAAPQSGY